MLRRRQQPRCIVRARLPLIALSLCAPIALAAQAPLAAPWDSVGKILKTSGTMTGGFYRYGWPRRDITLTIGDVTVAPAPPPPPGAGSPSPSQAATSPSRRRSRSARGRDSPPTRRAERP